MSKINNIPDYNISAIKQKTSVANVQTDTDAFSKTLREIMSPSKSAQPTETTAAIIQAQTMSPSFMRVTDPSSIKEVMNQTDILLSRLDNYAQLLEDPSKTLKDMEPLIDSIKNDADALNADAEKKLPEGSGIKNLVREFTIAANAEYMRFKRGDYI